jgi:NTE family protein
MKKLAFVLSGGVSRGALQVGALRALLETGFIPDLLVGTSIGAVNASFLAVRGVRLETIQDLVAAWIDASSADLLPSNYFWLSLRTIFNRPATSPFNRMRAFYIEHGLGPDLKFSDIRGVQLVQIAADLNAKIPVLYGLDPEESVLEGLLASTAIPPWISPLKVGERLLMDGGIVSNLPVEPALLLGATQIIALDLDDPRVAASGISRFRLFLENLLFTISRRQAEMEIALALERNVSVNRIELLSSHPVPMWDFRHTASLIEQGYDLTHQAIAGWEKNEPVPLGRWLRDLVLDWRKKDQSNELSGR